jgi:hypothetical protein
MVPKNLLVKPGGLAGIPGGAPVAVVKPSRESGGESYTPERVRMRLLADAIYSRFLGKATIEESGPGEIQVRYDGHDYRVSVTSQGKLSLSGFKANPSLTQLVGAIDAEKGVDRHILHAADSIHELVSRASEAESPPEPVYLPSSEEADRMMGQDRGSLPPPNVSEIPPPSSSPPSPAPDSLGGVPGGGSAPSSVSPPAPAGDSVAPPQPMGDSIAATPPAPTSFPGTMPMASRRIGRSTVASAAVVAEVAKQARDIGLDEIADAADRIAVSIGGISEEIQMGDEKGRTASGDGSEIDEGDGSQFHTTGLPESGSEDMALDEDQQPTSASGAPDTTFDDDGRNSMDINSLDLPKLPRTGARARMASATAASLVRHVSKINPVLGRRVMAFARMASEVADDLYSTAGLPLSGNPESDGDAEGGNEDPDQSPEMGEHPDYGAHAPTKEQVENRPKVASAWVVRVASNGRKGVVKIRSASSGEEAASIAVAAAGEGSTVIGCQRVRQSRTASGKAPTRKASATPRETPSGTPWQELKRSLRTASAKLSGAGKHGEWRVGCRDYGDTMEIVAEVSPDGGSRQILGSVLFSDVGGNRSASRISTVDCILDPGMSEFDLLAGSAGSVGKDWASRIAQQAMETVGDSRRIA